jgi:hypothetical protein
MCTQRLMLQNGFVDVRSRAQQIKMPIIVKMQCTMHKERRIFNGRSTTDLFNSTDRCFNNSARNADVSWCSTDLLVSV